jgi:acyl-CoA reductase-like NAD-dependent aldehyde dehydrogenase
MAPREVFSDGGMRESITHEPLGVIANISAWNYPVLRRQQRVRAGAPGRQRGAVQAERVRDAHGLEIGNLLHASGVPQDVFSVLVGGGRVGIELA